MFNTAKLLVLSIEKKLKNNSFMLHKINSSIINQKATIKHFKVAKQKKQFTQYKLLKCSSYGNL